jgi:hypothetical protein
MSREENNNVIGLDALREWQSIEQVTGVPNSVPQNPGPPSLFGDLVNGWSVATNEAISDFIYFYRDELVRDRHVQAQTLEDACTEVIRSSEMESTFVKELASVLIGILNMSSSTAGLTFFENILRTILQIPTAPDFPASFFWHWDYKKVGPRIAKKQLCYKDDEIVMILDLELKYSRVTTRSSSWLMRSIESDVQVSYKMNAVTISRDRYPIIRERFRIFILTRNDATERMFIESFGDRAPASPTITTGRR